MARTEWATQNLGCTVGKIHTYTVFLFPKVHKGVRNAKVLHITTVLDTTKKPLPSSNIFILFIIFNLEIVCVLVHIMYG